VRLEVRQRDNQTLTASQGSRNKPGAVFVHGISDALLPVKQ
jgi:hypothetical protein